MIQKLFDAAHTSEFRASEVRIAALHTAEAHVGEIEAVKMRDLKFVLLRVTVFKDRYGCQHVCSYRLFCAGRAFFVLVLGSFAQAVNKAE